MDTDTFRKGSMIACPASAEFLAPLSPDYKLHWVHPSRLVNGVCPACAKKFAKHKPAAVETPVDLNERHHHLDLEHDHVASVAPRDIEPATFFSYDDLDALLGTIEAAPEDARHLAGELIREVFAYCFSAKFKTKSELKLAASKLAVIAGWLRPDLLNGRTQTQVAQTLGLTKQALAKASVKFRDQFGLPPQNGRSQEARAAMRRARLANPVGRNHAAKQPAQLESLANHHQLTADTEA